MGRKKRTLLLHVGTNKTGTSTLQHSLYGSRDRLLDKAVLYSACKLHPQRLMHQWLVQQLLENETVCFEQNVRKVATEASNTEADLVFLSCEGIYNHWSDLSATAKQALGSVESHFAVVVWCVFREPVSYAMSVYSQLLKNPPNGASPCYGSDLAPEDLVKHPWFASRLDYAGFIREIEHVFPAARIEVSRYESADILEQARLVLQVDETVLMAKPARNLSLSEVGADLMRRLNSLGLPTQERQKLATSIMDLDLVIGGTGRPLVASDEMKRQVKALSAASEKYLAQRYGILWNESESGERTA